MKKIVIIFLFLATTLSCSTIKRAILPFDYVINKKNSIENPSFYVYVTPSSYGTYYDNILSNKIESALMQRKVKVLTPLGNKHIITTTGDINITTTNEISKQTIATYIWQSNYDDYSFKIISTSTQEIIAHGLFTNNIDKSVAIILKEMNIL